MGRSHTRAAAGVAALAAGALAAFALRPSPGTVTATLASRERGVEVRTQIIRRTIHIVRHESVAVLPRDRSRTSVLLERKARTGASGSHKGASGSALAVATRASGAHSGATYVANSGATATTRASGSHGTSSSGASGSHPVSTRASGSHGSTSSGRPVTRSSGSGGHGDDGGDGHGDGGGDN